MDRMDSHKIDWGDFRLIDNQEYHSKLLKEALNRANQEEKQQYAKILQRKSEISKRIEEIYSEQEALNEKDKANALPERPRINYLAPDRSHLGVMSKPCGGQQVTKETAEYYAKSKRYREELRVYGANNSAILNERLKLIQEYLELKVELDDLEEREKWLLLSIALGSQHSLLGYMQSKEDR